MGMKNKSTFILSSATQYSCRKVNNVTSFFGILPEIPQPYSVLCEVGGPLPVL